MTSWGLPSVDFPKNIYLENNKALVIFQAGKYLDFELCLIKKFLKRKRTETTK